MALVLLSLLCIFEILQMYQNIIRNGTLSEKLKGLLPTVAS